MGKRLKVREISGDTIVLCPRCKKGSTLDEWDNGTREECDTDEKRRDFVSLGFKKSWDKKSDLYYKCPRCNIFSNSDSLKVKGGGSKGLSGLGGKPAEPLFNMAIPKYKS